MRKPVLTSLALFALVRPLLGSPADPLSVALPDRDTKPPEGIDAPYRGDVTAQQGDATYTYDVGLPPGRHGMTPQLSLRYSSSAPLRGGVAAGWSLDLPTIERDPHGPGYRYNGQLLVQVSGDMGSGTRYRPLNDDGQTRISFDGRDWIVATPDGIVRTLRAIPGQGGMFVPVWHVTSEADAFGNTIVYTWGTTFAGGGVDFQLQSIEYTSNPAAGLVSFARVELAYAPLEQCPGAIAPIGAQLDHRTGDTGQTIVHASQRLVGIKTFVRDTASSAWRTVRQYTLTYDAAELSCSIDHPPLRYLTQIDVSAYDPSGVATAAPPVKFGYGPRKRQLTQTLINSQLGLVERGTDRGPEGQLMDVDGDGILDQVSVTTPYPPTVYAPSAVAYDPAHMRCGLTWRKGLFGGGFDPIVHTTALPSVYWQSGGPAGVDACTLSGQYATRAGFAMTPPDPGNPVGNACILPEALEVSYTFHDWDGDGDPDLIATVWSTGDAASDGDFPALTAYDTSSGSGSTGGTEHGPCGDAWDVGTDADGTIHCECSTGEVWDGSECAPAQPTCADFNSCQGDGSGTTPTVPGNPPACPQSQTKRTGAMHVYINNGGSFDPTDAGALLTPTIDPPRSGAFMDTSTASEEIALSRMVDLDGDGHLDLIDAPSGNGDYAGATYQTSPFFNTNLGQRDGSFTPRTWVKPTWGLPAISTTQVGGLPNIIEQPRTATFTDVDGDGLVDMLVLARNASGTDELDVSYNFGEHFGPLISLGTFVAPAMTRTEMPSNWFLGAPLQVGHRANEIDLLDIDDDDQPDLFRFITAGSVSNPAQTHIAYRIASNGPSTSYLDPSWEPLESRIEFVSPHAWYRANAFIDVTGDGRSDLVTFGANGTTVLTDAAGPAPRLLATVDNGRGAVTSYSYARSTDPAIVTSTGRNDARWVVQSVVENPGFGQPARTTSYAYANPVFGTSGPADTGPKHFMGFSTVTIDESGQAGPGSSRVIDTFSYATSGADTRGHLANQVTYIRVGSGYTPVTYETSHWTNAPLGSNHLATFTYRDTQTTISCGPNQTVDQCKDLITNRSATYDTWKPWLGLTGSPIFYEHTNTFVMNGQFGGTQTNRDFAEHAGQAPYQANDYRILQILDETQDVGYVAVTEARTITSYDVYGLPIETDSYSGPTTYSRTVRTFDNLTGNLLTEKRPHVVAAGGSAVTTHYYDVQRLYEITTTDELGHVTTQLHDVGTGALVKRSGPNHRSVTVPNCTLFGNPCISTVYAPEEWSVDGFGRVTQHRVATDPASGGGYALVPVEWTTYVDSSLPTTRKIEKLRDWTGTTKVTAIDTYDGFGRVTQHVDKRFLVDRPDAVTSYQYDMRGDLLVESVPDPRVDSTAQVAYLYARDGLGRTTQLTRPDGTTSVTSYAGLSMTSQLVSPSDGAGGATTVDRDPLGRIVLVHQPDATGDHLTHYYPDARDRVVQIVDADGHATNFAYDWQDHRTQLTRGTRQWLYTYDEDGRLRTERSPVPSGADPTLYTSTTTYDDLGRILTHTPAARGMTAARQAQLGIGTMTTTYDVGSNAVGHPSHVTLPFGTIDYTYDVHDRAVNEARTTNVSYRAALSVSQSIATSFNTLGEPLDITANDGTKWSYAYDARGMVSSVGLSDPTLGTATLATYTRSLAGVPRTRTSTYDQRRDWTYDALGRVTYDRVWRPSVATTFGERTYGYDGLGHVRMISGQLAGQSADATYDYDLRGRLVAAQGPAAYNATLAYSPTGNITHASIAGSLDASDRSVDYQYGALDPQAVDKLVVSSTNATYASLGYDLAGNMTTRTINGTTQTITSDGDDLVREVAGPGGTETYYFGPSGQRLVAITPTEVKLWFGPDETHFSTTGFQTLRWHHVAAGEPIARIEKSKVSSIELQYADALENLMLAVNAQSAVVAGYLYGAFGELVWELGDTNHRRTFNGKETDLYTGLRAYGYRSYDPVLLRWTASDPLYRFAPDAAWAEPERANLYAFSLNNPLSYYDPDGRAPGFWLTVGKVIAEAIPMVDDAGHGEAAGVVAGAIGIVVTVGVRLLPELELADPYTAAFELTTQADDENSLLNRGIRAAVDHVEGNDTSIVGRGTHGASRRTWVRNHIYAAALPTVAKRSQAAHKAAGIDIRQHVDVAKNDQDTTMQLAKDQEALNAAWSKDDDATLNCSAGPCTLPGTIDDPPSTAEGTITIEQIEHQTQDDAARECTGDYGECR